MFEEMALIGQNEGSTAYKVSNRDVSFLLTCALHPSLPRFIIIINVNLNLPMRAATSGPASRL